MRRIVMLLVGVLGVAATAAPFAPTGSAQSADCQRALMATPVETVALPPGMHWVSLAVGANGSWFGSIERDSEPDAPTTASLASASVSVACVWDASLFMKRTAEVEAFVGDRTKIGVVPIGDESYATRGEYPELELFWRHGAIVGNIYQQISYDDGDFEIGDFEAIALALDSALP